MKILSIFGTRPEAIKMAPVIKELEKYPDRFTSLVCVTAQHREMLDQVLALFEIKPDYDLNIMVSDQDLFEVTSKVIQGLKPVLEKERPDLVLVQGDTTTTMAASLAAFYCKIPIGHVEAGLRTFNKFAPFPEEINRSLTTHMADLHFAPTKRAGENLAKEGVPEESIHVTGNTVIDALFLALQKIKSENLEVKIIQGLTARYPSLNDIFPKSLLTQDSKLIASNLNEHKLILVTGHRRESFGEGFERICAALKQIGEREDVQIVYPVHLNPNVQEPVQRMLGDCSRIHLIEPLIYLQFVYMMNRSYLIITDSGGIQEEAPSLGKPVLVMRETTERPEAVDAGTVRLVGTDSKKILKETEKLLDYKGHYKKMAFVLNPYGDGKAADRIVKIVARFRKRLARC